MDGIAGTKGSQQAVVTGGAGFLGGHLCARLLDEGFDVVAIAILATGQLCNVQPLLGHPRFRFRRHDVVEPFRADADWIFNLACCASSRHRQRDPEKIVRTCIEGAVNVLHEARRNRARVFQASTSEVYGEPEVHPQRENYRGAVNPVGPRACYDEGKRCAEALLFDYHRLHGIEIKIARIFDTYGPKMQSDGGCVVANFILQALRNEPLTIHGDGSQTRSFCHVDDLVEGMFRLMKSPAEFAGPVNLGNPREVTMLELARLVIELTGSRSRLVCRPMPADGATRRRPDISLARTTLDWTPRIALEEGLCRTIAWFEQALGEAASAEELADVGA
jgi:UDP-glucuronate decarboxylase